MKTPFFSSIIIFLQVCFPFSTWGNNLIPIENFATDPLYTALSISPEGDSIAFLREFADLSYLCFSTIDSDQINRLKLGTALAYGTKVPREVATYHWINNERLLITTQVWDRIYGSIAINKDGKRWKGLTGWEAAPSEGLLVSAFEILFNFDHSGDDLLMLDRRDPDARDRKFPHVMRLDSITGATTMIQENPGDIGGWLLDDSGTVRIGVKSSASNQLIYRASAEGDWESIELPGRGHEKLRALGFGEGDHFYVKGFNEADRWCLYPYELADRSLGESILSDETYDTVPDGKVPTFAEIHLAAPILSSKDNHLLGMRYLTESPRIRWFDEHFAKIQKSIDLALPETVNIFVDASKDQTRMVFLAMSDVQPGIYYLLDQREKNLKVIGARMPWLDPKTLSPMHPIQYTARDGTGIHGYLTLPLGQEPKSLPLIVMPHGGPWVRDTWGFDPIVQLLANRGYAVLQMNYRGSIGYGSAFRMAGSKEIGGKIQTDIEDAARWAINIGLANPQRLAIVGMSYGGYSALFAAGDTPDLYKCAISISGVSDWTAMFQNDQTRPEYRQASDFWKKEIGDPELDEQTFQRISPYYFAEKIKIPVLFIHGKEDSTVPINQAKQMAKLLKKQGNVAQELYLGWEAHGLRKQRSREKAYAEIISFLEKYL